MISPSAWMAALAAFSPTENIMNRVEFEKTFEVLSGGFRVI
jgi:hypothetical protein